MRKQTWFPLFGLAILLVLSACSFLQKPTPEQADTSDKTVSGETSSAAVPEETEGSVSKPKAHTSAAGKPAHREKMRMIRHYLNGSDYSAALALIRNEISTGTPEKELQAVYVKALNGAINKGRTLLEQNRPAPAGRMFRAALGAYPGTPAVGQKVLLAAHQLEAKIAHCAEKLMERGLSHYREGQLNAAIDLWKKILAFDPQHQASRNAIQTAHIQISNLEKITGGSQ